MVDRNAAFRQHFLKVAIADRIATIPAHRPQDHITLEMAPLEIRHRSVRPISAKHAQASRFLQQSRVGLNAVSGAVLASAGKIISVDVNAASLEAAKKFGATHTINSAEVDPVAAVKELTGGFGVKYV